MSTKVSNTKTQPAIIMDKLHIDSFTFHQERMHGSKKKIGAAGVLYGLDENGAAVFDKETFGVSDTDISETIVLAAVAAGATPEEFMLEYANQKAAVTAELAADTCSDAKLMAYFEAALGRIFELHGKITVDGVE